MKYQLVKKAYKLNLYEIYDPYHLSDIIHFGETRGQAKSKIFREAMREDLSLTDGPITFLNIPIKRCKKADLYLFENKELPLWKINETLAERERIKSLDSLLSDTSITHFYIKKGSYYKPNSSGYTDYKIFAGIYAKNEAISHARSCREITLEPIDINNHNKMLNDTISNLQSRIISSNQIANT